MFAGACSHDGTPTSPAGTTSATIAAQFNRMGDSVLASGGSTADAAPFYGAAGLAGLAPQITTVTIDIDGTPTKLSAVALAIQISGGPMIACPLPMTGSSAVAPFLCPWGIPLVTRTLFAWSPDKPARIITLVAMVDSGPISTPSPIMGVGTVTGTATGVGTTTASDSATATSSAVLRPIPAHLEYSDGAGAVWWGTSGTQRNSVKANGKACPAPPTATANAPRPGAIPPSSCQQADFTFAFSGAVGVPPIPLRKNSASGTHTISLNSLALTGVFLKLAVMALGPGH
jgi:hypothetical protein